MVFPIENSTIHELAQRVARVKLHFLQIYKAANAGHVGSSLSVAEILTTCRFSWMRSPTDELILSKGHAAAALYAVLVEAGLISLDSLKSFYKDGTCFAAHPPPRTASGNKVCYWEFGSWTWNSCWDGEGTNA